MKQKTLCVAALLLAALSGTVSAAESSSLTLPNEQEATNALLTMMEMTDYAEQVRVKLGTCLAVPDKEHLGKIACTVSVHIGAGSSETQADFYRDGDSWVAEPSASQELLPFPAPKLDKF